MNIYFTNIKKNIEPIITLFVLSSSLVLSIAFYDIGHAFIIAGLLFIYLILAYSKLNRGIFSISFILLTLMMVVASHSVLNLYSRIYWYDKPVHFTAEFILTLLSAHIIVTKKLAIFKNKYIFFFVILSIGLSLGGLWEIIEWFLNLLKPAKFGYTATDTAMDLLVDLFGVIVAGIFSIYKLYKD